ncbi:hypothetical protein Clacol_005492 [Clathrus columnatus]|uniref:Holocytochrome c-type synthase n=1 Tax=Clathrus columnatus TaxID=1419009 RepID=A0AAV5AH49_9AGAM|nr:hypothetical protein Clacol_005492 [Clathrus columnatus]
MGQTISQNSPSSQNQAKCPIDHKSQQESQCPIKRLDLNPLNNIPSDLSNYSSTSLPTQREASTIPKNGIGETWEYPSPQQFHNALLRKGMETAEEDVGMMVQVHNWLNEVAWNEVLKWEQKANPELTSRESNIQLARFQGRPGELSPKARFFLLLGRLMPSKFNTEPPFDRHDWIVRRPRSNEEVRYVIDYYSAPPEPDGTPAFSLDVRPALDSFGSIRTRIAVATEEVWEQLRTKQNRNSTPGRHEQ